MHDPDDSRGSHASGHCATSPTLCLFGAYHAYSLLALNT